MHKAFLILASLGAAVSFATVADAQRGYSPQEIDYYCSLGSQTPLSIRPYCGGGGGYYRGGGGYGGEYGYGRELSGRDLRYYCSLGSQTPASVRGDCVRLGYWR